ncbi:unnamed protein product [Auanema sp. JU1783]|nr:unnamed protein product [Auanema sp. JU1783]
MRLLLLLLSTFSLTWGLGSVPNFCNGSLVPIKDLDQKLIDAFSGSYKITTVLTDWATKTTQSVIEISDKDRKTTIISDRDGTDLQYISDQGRFILINNTANSCSVQKEYKPFQLNDAILKRLGADGNSIADLVKKIAAKNYKGSMLSTRIMSGVEGIQWITCVNDTNPPLQVELIFTGDLSIKPVSAAFKNPLVLFFRLSEFPNINSTEPTTSFSFEIQTYSPAQDSTVFDVPNGKVCEGWPSVKLPLTLPEPFSGIVTYKKGDSVIRAKVYYSNTSSTTAVCVDSLKSGEQIPFFNTKTTSDNVMSVIHDFNSGYEYSLASGKCASLAAIPADSADVLKNSPISIRPINEHFVNESLAWGQYGSISHFNGEELTVWRAADGESVLEVHIGKSQWTFTKTTKNVIDSSVEITLAPLPPITVAVERSRECFADSSSGNNTFTFAVKGKKMADVLAIGESTLISALAAGLSKVALINPLRVSALFSPLPSGDLGVFLTVADRNQKVPAETGKFNYTAEVTTDVLFNLLNSTFASNDWQFDVPTEDKKTETWLAKSSSLARYPLPAPPPQPAPYQGYTGGSMFVLGIFSLIIGSAIGAGIFFFITKKQGISTLAYQVFE